MKLAVFVEFFPPNLGSDRRIYEIMTRLSRKHEIHFLVFPSFRMLLGQISYPQDRLHFQDKEAIVVQHGITAHYLPTSSLLLRLWKKSYVLAYVLTVLSLFFKVFKTLKKVDPTTIVLNYPSVYTGILGFIVGKKFLQKPVLLDFNDLIGQYTSYLLNVDPRNMVARFFIQVQDYIARSSDKIVTPTNYIKRYSSSLGVADEKITVVPNGVDTKRFCPQKSFLSDRDPRQKRVSESMCVYCGRLDVWAGANMIRRLSQALASHGSHTLLAVVGKGAEERDLAAKNIIAFGEVPYGRVPEVLTSADVILVPFPNNEVSCAASPLKLFEGMAVGKAVVASDVDGIREVVSNRENGVLVDPEDINGWANAIRELLNNSSMAKWIGQNARKTAEEKYDWELLAAKYEKVLTE